ncbi:MAG: DMT family transporter [Bacteroidota bacterium]
MFNDERKKGVLLAFIATLALANVYIFSKAALNKVHLFQFGFYWFGFALILNLIFIRITKKKIKLSEINRKARLAIFLNAFFEVLGTILFFTAIKLVENPAIVSFIVNLGPVFTLILGFFFLSERFKLIEYGGIAITLIGVLLINYSSGTSFAELLSKGTLIIVFSSLFFSIALTIAKKNIQKIEPVILTSSRIILLLLISFAFVLIEGLSFSVDVSSVLYMAGGAFMGPFLAVLSSYYSLKYIEVSITNIIISTKSVLVIIGTYFFFNLVMSGNQLVGGALTIVGIVVISLAKRINNLSILKKKS